jgi:hypothetical protein
VLGRRMPPSRRLGDRRSAHAGSRRRGPRLDGGGGLPQCVAFAAPASRRRLPAARLGRAVAAPELGQSAAGPPGRAGGGDRGLRGGLCRARAAHPVPGAGDRPGPRRLLGAAGLHRLRPLPDPARRPRGPRLAARPGGDPGALPRCRLARRPRRPQRGRFRDEPRLRGDDPHDPAAQGLRGDPAGRRGRRHGLRGARPRPRGDRVGRHPGGAARAGSRPPGRRRAAALGPRQGRTRRLPAGGGRQRPCPPALCRARLRARAVFLRLPEPRSRPTGRIGDRA